MRIWNICELKKIVDEESYILHKCDKFYNKIIILQKYYQKILKLYGHFLIKLESWQKWQKFQQNIKKCDELADNLEKNLIRMWKICVSNKNMIKW